MRCLVMLLMLGFAVAPVMAHAQTPPAVAAGGAPPPAPPDDIGSPPDDTSPGHGMRMQKLHDAFTAANTTHDGHLTLAQAQTAGLKLVIKNFAEIDSQHRGYVTFDELEAWKLDQMAQRLEQEAAQLRAEDQ